MFESKSSYSCWRVWILSVTLGVLILFGLNTMFTKSVEVPLDKREAYYKYIEETKHAKLKYWSSVNDWAYVKALDESTEQANHIYGTKSGRWYVAGAIIGVGLFMAVFPSIFDFSGLLLKRFAR